MTETEICDHSVIEHFRKLDEFYESDLTCNSDMFFKITLSAATHYKHRQLITRMLSDSHCQLNCLTSSMLPYSAVQEIKKPGCFLNRFRLIETVIVEQKVGILTKL